MNKLILTIILTVVALGLTASFTRSEFSEYRAIKAEAESYTAALDQADELSELREDLLLQLNQIDVTDRNRLEKFLPRNIDTVRLTIEVSSIARNVGMDISQFSFAESESMENSDELMIDAQEVAPVGPGSIQTSANYSLVDMTLTATGTYSEFKDFIESLENNLRLTDVESISISQGESDEDEYRIVLRTYWLGT